MPYCEWIKLPDGTLASVRFAGKRPKLKRCYVCGRSAPNLCDYRLAAGKTCDRPCCAAHSKHTGPDEDLCQEHAAL